MNAVTDIEAYKALLAIPTYASSGEAEKSKDADALLAHEAIAAEVRRTAGRFCREDRAEGPKSSFLIGVQRGLFIQEIHEKRPDSLCEVIRWARGRIRRKIEMQFGHNKKKWLDDDMPRPKRPKVGGSKRTLTEAEEDRLEERKIADPITLHCDWATKSDTGLPTVIRPRRRRGPRLDQDDAPGAVEWYSRRD